MRIPRIIHQTYPGTALPEALRDNVADLVSANPGWDHRLYDDQAIERFISDYYPREVLAAYLRIRPEYGAARADLFRYLAIYRLGGVYLDMKSRFIRPIDEVTDGDEGIVLAQWRNGGGGTHQGFGLHEELGILPVANFSSGMSLPPLDIRSCAP
ncbi:MAG: hypothetical protein IPI83_08030 [Sphingomonadales bacterium]|nr:hypothetical protein [Sphingomonadales bacterium]